MKTQKKGALDRDAKEDISIKNSEIQKEKVGKRNKLIEFFSVHFTRINIFKINFAMFIICLIWVSIFFIVPAALPANSVDLGTEGVSGVRPEYENNQEEIEEIDNAFARAIYSFGDSTCHQNSSRSYFINGNQMPLCARDIGIYAGFAFGALIVSLLMLEIKIWWILGALIPIGIDGTTQLFTSYESNNPLRLFTGGLAGIMTTMVLGIMFYEIYMAYRYNKEKKMRQKEEMEKKDFNNKIKSK